MRPSTTLAAGLAVLMLGTIPVLARSAPKVSCKKIRDAVNAGHTMDQLIKEFDTDADTVMKCTQKKGKRRAAPKERKKKKAKSASTSRPRTTAPSKSSEPTSRKQNRAPNLRLAPPPLR